MIRTGRLNSFNFGIIFVRDLMVGNKSSFKRKKAAPERLAWHRTVGTAVARIHF